MPTDIKPKASAAEDAHTAYGLGLIAAVCTGLGSGLLTGALYGWNVGFGAGVLGLGLSSLIMACVIGASLGKSARPTVMVYNASKGD